MQIVKLHWISFLAHQINKNWIAYPVHSMEKPSYTAGGNVFFKKYDSKGTTPLEGNLAVGNKMTLIYLAFNHITSPILNYRHTKLSSARLFVITEYWKPHRCPTTGSWSNNYGINAYIPTYNRVLGSCFKKKIREDLYELIWWISRRYKVKKVRTCMTLVFPTFYIRKKGQWK